MYIRKICDEKKSAGNYSPSGATAGTSGMDEHNAVMSVQDFNSKHFVAQFLHDVRYSVRYYGREAKCGDSIL